MGLTQDLYDLHIIDQQVRGLSRGMNLAAAHVKSQSNKLEELRRQKAELEDQLRHARAAAGNLENDSNAAEERIEKLRTQMNSAKTNKEYSTFLVEINTLKLEKGKLEEQALELMGKADALKGQVEAVSVRVAEQEKVRALAEEELGRRRAEVGDQLEQVKTKRISAARALPADVLAAFEKLAESTDGEAMADVSREDPRSDYMCGGCYMALPIERVNLLATTDKMVRCPSCSRILYLASETREALAGK